MSNLLLHIVLPASVLLLGAFGAFVVHRRATVMSSHGDPGGLWSRVSWRFCLVLGAPLLLSGLGAELLPAAIYRPGLHLQADLTGFRSGSTRTAYVWMLLFPWAAWGGLLLWGLTENPTETGGKDSLAGALDSGLSRRWLLLCASVPALMVVLTWHRLGGGANAYPAADWSSAAILVLSLVGAALSHRSTPPLETSAPTPTAKTPAGSLPPWPEAMQARGVHVPVLDSLEASQSPRAPRSDSAREVQDRLHALGAHQVAPELVETIDRLLHPSEGDESDLGRAALILAPDECGQDEIVALAAATLASRFHETTLVVTPGDEAARIRHLERWLLGPERIDHIRPAGKIHDDSWVWVSDAETLSDHLLPQLSDRSLLRRIGLVVWWGLESYTGVAGANLWAISRRLHRLLDHGGRPDLRTLAFIRNAPHGAAQLDAFVHRLLPHRFPPASQTHIPRRRARQIWLHRLDPPHADTLAASSAGGAVSPGEVALAALRASVASGWLTGLRPPREISEVELSWVRAHPAGRGTVGDALVERRSDAGAWIEQPLDGEVLSLPEIVDAGGRALPPGLPHHTAILRPQNPYAEHLLETVDQPLHSGFGTSRRLICAEGHPSILRRHLQLALKELPDTRTGLLRNFLWEESLIRRTLDRMAFEGNLQRHEVRYLNERGDLQRDPYFDSKESATSVRRPLDTVGAELLEVRAPDEALDADGVRLRLDPERITILAYPHRIFLSRGKRYRIEEWSDAESIRQRGWIRCRQEGRTLQTWRIRSRYLRNLQPAGPAAWIGTGRTRLSRLAADLIYEETVHGVLRVDPSQGESGERLRFVDLDHPVATSFPTRALLLAMSERVDGRNSLSSVAQAMRHLLPVHLGADEDSLEVVPVFDVDLDGSVIDGLAIVDLFPGGIGLIDAIADDDALLLDLLSQARTWLDGCGCKSGGGCDRCLRSLAAQAESPDVPPSRAAALDLLGRLLP